ncbi:hypothetical protein GCM10009710_33270 [Aeromicrobium alkaliterrae]|uniref:Major facilitator superfamily (MFS) profile domain-containing protein n=2 Tax=Aeromicrobium alkaliterrae TaxID=302168 RepID=A0ABP4WBI8_9ACTN
MLPTGLLPLMSADLGVSESRVGVLVSAWAITIALVGIPLVRLTLRWDRTVLLAGCLTVMAASNLITAAATDFTAALAGRILAATAHGLFWAVVVSHVAAIVMPARLGRALAIVLAGPTMAGLAGLPAAALIAEIAGWRTVFVALSGVLVVVAVVLVVALRQHRSEDDETAANGSWDRSGWAVSTTAVAGGLVLIGHFAAFTFVTTLITDHAGFDRSSIPALLLAFGIAGAAGVAAAGYASDRFPRSSVAASAAAVALGLFLLTISKDQACMFVVGVAVWGLAIGAFPPLLQARVLRVSSPAFRPMAGSIVVTALNLGVAAGAAAGGVALRASPQAVAAAALSAAALGTIALALLPQREAE